MSALYDLVASFPTAPAELLAERSLLRRCDAKYQLSPGQLECVLPALLADYAAVDACGTFFAAYRTLYFDTAALRCFHDHRRGKRLRHKLRIRHYDDRRLSYFEVKTRRDELLSEKQRLELPFGEERLGGAELALVRACTGIDEPLRPQVRVAFHRVTLLGLGSGDRVTIDLDLDLGHAEARPFGDQVIVEVKQATAGTGTPMVRALHAAGLRAHSSSKYTVALRYLRAELREEVEDRREEALDRVHVGEV